MGIYKHNKHSVELLHVTATYTCSSSTTRLQVCWTDVELKKVEQTTINERMFIALLWLQ